MQELLQIMANLQLKDCWICAGTVRNFIWNSLSHQPAFDKDTDIDMIFYDPEMTWQDTQKIEEALCKQYPQYQWQVRNQVEMHQHNPFTSPYKDSRDAMSKYPETCTAVGIRLDENQQLEWFCPYGIGSITSFEIHPTPHFLEHPERMLVYQKRLAKKDWLTKWPQLTIYYQ